MVEASQYRPQPSANSQLTSYNGVSPPHAPKANAYAERWVQTVRAECLDWLLVVGRGHLERTLKVYVAHYNTHRPRRARDWLSWATISRPESTDALCSAVSCTSTDELHEHLCVPHSPRQHPWSTSAATPAVGSRLVACRRPPAPPRRRSSRGSPWAGALPHPVPAGIYTEPQDRDRHAPAGERRQDLAQTLRADDGQEGCRAGSGTCNVSLQHQAATQASESLARLRKLRTRLRERTRTRARGRCRTRAGAAGWR
jgi:hypothetical protein